jgi:hypothetical protein
MDQTFRQPDPRFFAFIQAMRNGTITPEIARPILERQLHNLSLAEQTRFKEHALYVMPTWKSTVPITLDYLQRLNQPVARIEAQYQYKHVNHTAKEISLPSKSALCKDAKVMLLVNFVVEEGLFNGAVGTVVDICYSDPSGPQRRNVQPDYVVVDFPNVKFPDGKAWDAQNPTHVPIPAVTVRCEKSCCSVTTIPLRVCKAVTIHKSQGLTVGNGHFWELLVVGLPSGKGSGSTLGLEQVSFSRASELENLTQISTTDSPVTVERLVSIRLTRSDESLRDS